MTTLATVGDIFYSPWGYEQTQIDYYQVVKTTAAMVTLRKIEKVIVRGQGEPQEYVMPIADAFKGDAFSKKVRASSYQGAAVTLTSYSSAYKWDGKEKAQTGWAFGH